MKTLFAKFWTTNFDYHPFRIWKMATKKKRMDDNTLRMLLKKLRIQRQYTRYT